ncbi:hypothetical protein AB9K34_02385 [Sedimentitalea sp. XS_ASV28]|uniref:hypothetical protein n=1 Tax=Sedimentitalea sp. XS_ASV28 TaxID=3241296 RepID=UPI003518260C
MLFHRHSGETVCTAATAKPVMSVMIARSGLNQAYPNRYEQQVNLPVNSRANALIVAALPHEFTTKTVFLGELVA